MYKLNNIYIGIVVNNQDWENRGRVQVFIPHLSNTLYKGWNESGEDIKFKSFDSSVFTPDIVSRLTDVLPWAEMAAPFFGGGTGAPVNQHTYKPTPAPTFMTFGSPTYMNYGSTGGIATGKNGYDLNAIVKNSNGGNSASYFNGLKVGQYVDVKNLNSVFAQRIAGFVNELQSAGYNVSINSGFRAPTIAEKNAIGSTGTDQETLYKRNKGKGTARPYESNHGQGISADITISGNGKFGYINVTTISTEENDIKNIRSPELAVLEKKWGVDIPVNKEYWHYQPAGTAGDETVSFAEIAALNNNNVPAFSGSAIAQNGTATKEEFPKLDGINNSAGEVSKSETSAISLVKKNLNLSNDQANNAAIAYRTAYNESIKRNLTPKQASIVAGAIVGNIKQESSFNPNLTHDGGRGYGLLGEQGIHLERMRNYAKNIKKENINNGISVQTQIEALFNDPDFLNGRPSSGGPSWKGLSTIANANSVEEAARLFSGQTLNPKTGWGYLRPGNPQMENRISYAKQANQTFSQLGEGELASIEQSPNQQHNNVVKTTTVFQNAGYGVDNIGGAGTAMGMFSIPQVGAKAYVMFLDGNPLKPIVVGCYQEPSNVRAT